MPLRQVCCTNNKAPLPTTAADPEKFGALELSVHVTFRRDVDRVLDQLFEGTPLTTRPATRWSSRPNFEMACRAIPDKNVEVRRGEAAWIAYTSAASSIIPREQHPSADSEHARHWSSPSSAIFFSGRTSAHFAAFCDDSTYLAYSMTGPDDRLPPGKRKLLEEAQKNVDKMQRMNNQVKVLIDRTRALLARLLGNDQVRS